MWTGWSLCISRAVPLEPRPQLPLGRGSHVYISILGGSVYRQVQKLDLHRKYDAEDEFQLRAKMLSSVAFPQVGEVAAGFGRIETLFADDENALCAYFETNYVGRRFGGERRHPTFGIELRGVSNRMEAARCAPTTRFRRSASDSPRVYRMVTAHRSGPTSGICTRCETSQRRPSRRGSRRRQGTSSRR